MTHSFDHTPAGPSEAKSANDFGRGFRRGTLTHLGVLFHLYNTAPKLSTDFVEDYIAGKLGCHQKTAGFHVRAIVATGEHPYKWVGENHEHLARVSRDEFRKQKAALRDAQLPAEDVGTLAPQQDTPQPEQGGDHG